MLRPRRLLLFTPRTVSSSSSWSQRSSAALAVETDKPPKKRRKLILLSGVGAGLVGTFGVAKYYRNCNQEEAERRIRSAKEWKVPSRDANIEQLKSGKQFDIVVVGGGATGAGVALEAQLRGLSVACVEQEDFASGTSSKSTKLIWAGSRYLVKALVNLFSLTTLSNPGGSWSDFMGQWHMVLGCFRERTYMLTMNPHLTNWVPIAVPLDKWIIWPPPFEYPLAALGPATGLFVIFFKFYDALSFWTSPSSFVMTSQRTRAEFPQMHGATMKYTSVFYEGAHNDARTNVAIALTAANHGACMVNYAKVNNIAFDEKGLACGVEVSDMTALSSEPIKVSAKRVVYAGGPFTDGLRQLSEGKDVKPVVNGSGGTHIVLPPYFCPRHMGLVDMMTSRGSFLFFLPWEGYTLVGTTDVKSEPDLHHEVPEDEIQFLVNECEKYLNPSLEVRRSDVMSAWYGIRPLCGDPHAKDQSSASRDHVISHHPSNGITFISGGKWTTWREMAEDCVDQVLARSSELKQKASPSCSLETPLIGTGKSEDFPDGWHENIAVKLTQKYGVAYDVAQHLARNYGTHACDVLACAKDDDLKDSNIGIYKRYKRLYEGVGSQYPYLEAEVRYAVKYEYACTPADVLCRRTRLAFLNSTAARLVLPRVTQIMGECLGWDEARQRQELLKSEEIMASDFAGPVPNKSAARIRTACTADIKDIFDRMDVHKKGALTEQGIADAARELGFPMGEAETHQAMKEMDGNGNGSVSFPEFLSWWNSCKDSETLRKKILRSCIEGHRLGDSRAQ